MENAHKFKQWIDETIIAGKKELEMTDRTLFFVLATLALEIALRVKIQDYMDGKK